MIDFGKTLREAREAKGYSVSQLAEITHILPQVIENLEKEDFTRIVAPIYGRGFVKLYCETVGLEPQPFVAEFMEIYNGNRPPVIRMKEPEAPTVAEPPPPAAEEPVVPEAKSSAEAPLFEAPAPEPPPVIEAPPAPEDPPSFNFDPLPEPPTTPEPMARPVREPEPFKPGADDLPFPEDAPEPRRDYRLPGYSMPEVPRGVWRFGVLIAAALVVLALIFFSCRALYRATMQVPENEDQTEERMEKPSSAASNVKPQTSNVKPQTSNLKPQTRAPRKPVAVPPLYID